MGIWGPGNFDSDTAADHVSILASKLVADIETAIGGDPSALEPDKWDGTTVPCNVELLTLLAKQRWVGVTLPAPAAVSAWSKTFIDVWDANIDGLRPKPEWKTRRREVLVKTFAELEELCAIEAASQAVPFAGATRAKSPRARKASTPAKAAAKSSRSSGTPAAKSSRPRSRGTSGTKAPRPTASTRRK